MRGHLLACAGERGVARFALVCSLLAIASCGGGGNNAAVSGTVTYRGKPLPRGQVTFFGVQGDVLGIAAIRDGSYRLDKLPVGPVKITVAVSGIRLVGKPKSKASEPDRRHDPTKVPPPVRIPVKYSNPGQSGLTYEVKPGTQEHPIDLN